MRSLLFVILLTVSAIMPAYHCSLSAQQKTVEQTKIVKPQDDSKIFNVMVIVLVVWFGIAAYLVTIDRRVRKLEKDINEL